MEELDLVELFELFWSKKLIIIIMILITSIIGVIYTYNFVTPKYKSTTSLVLAQVTETNNGSEIEETSINQTDVQFNSKLIPMFRESVKSNRVLNEVVKLYKIDIETLKKNVSVAADNDTQIIKITYTDVEPDTAKKVANKIAESFDKYVKEEFQISNIHVLDYAETAKAPYNVNHIKDIAIFAIIGGVIAVLYILVINMLDNTVGSSKEIEDELGTIVLASIPQYKQEKEEEIKKGKKNSTKKGGRRYEK